MMNTPSSTFKSELLREQYHKYTHPCGLDVYVFPKKLSTTYALLATKYGSIDNRFGVKGESAVTSVPDGIAHFLEHKLFANEDGSDAFEHFSAIGADANAYTSFNKTVYLFSCTDNFDSALSELISFVFHPYFTEESVKRERGIIAQEIKMYDDSPGESCYCGMLEGLYEKHSIRRNICGSVSSIEKITPELLYECYRVFYNPENMALVVCGDVSPDDVVSIADKCLPSEKHTIDIVRAGEGDSEGASVASPRRIKKMKVSKPIFNVGIKDVDIPSTPIGRQRKDAAMSILNEMLFSRAGALYAELFESGAISPELSYCYTINESFAFNSIAGEANDPEAVLKKICEYLERVAKDGLSRKDFEIGKKVMYAEFVKEFDSTDNIANNLVSFVFDGSDMLGYAEVIASITFEEVNELFARSFKNDFFTMSVVYPLEHTN